MTKGDVIKSINTIQEFAEFLNEDDNLTRDDIEDIIESKGWYDLTFEDCLDEECTLQYICSDGENVIIYNNATNKVYVKHDDIVRDVKPKKESFHHEKETDVTFRTKKGHDICIRVKREQKLGYDGSTIELSVDGQHTYKTILTGTREDNVCYIVLDENTRKYCDVIIPDDVFYRIMYLRAERFTSQISSVEQKIINQIKDKIANNMVAPKSELYNSNKELNSMFSNTFDATKLSCLEVIESLMHLFTFAPGGDYKGFLAAESVDVIKRLYPEEF